MVTLKIRRRGFTLLEIMAVMAVIAIVIAMSVPTLKKAALGTALTRAGQLLSDQFQLARQEATGRNRDVQVRLIWIDSQTPGYRAVQLWASSLTNASTYEPISKMVMLPPETLISSNAQLSPLLANATIPETTGNIPGRGETKYCGYRFRAGGQTDLPFNATNTFVTVIQNQDVLAAATPKNFFVVQVDPVNGRTRTFRP